MLTGPFKAKLKAALIKFEKSVPYLYQDSIGQMTIGVGHLVEPEIKVVPLKLYRRSDQKLATVEEKKAAWQAVKKENRRYTGQKDHKQHVYGAGHYEKLSSLFMKDADVDVLTEDHIVEFHGYLRRAFTRQNGYLTEFDDMPENARLALFDMMFNMGPTRFPRPWHQFVAALKRGDWQKAATQSNRPQVNAERNAYVRDLLSSVEPETTPRPIPDLRSGLYRMA
jgi:GH24 family phage-related lysozyme (muramidase)